MQGVNTSASFGAPPPNRSYHLCHTELMLYANKSLAKPTPSCAIDGIADVYLKPGALFDSCIKTLNTFNLNLRHCLVNKVFVNNIQTEFRVFNYHDVIVAESAKSVDKSTDEENKFTNFREFRTRMRGANMCSEETGELSIEWPKDVPLCRGGWVENISFDEWKSARKNAFCYPNSEFATQQALKLFAECKKQQVFAHVRIEYTSFHGIIWVDDLQYQWPLNYALVGKEERTFGFGKTLDENGNFIQSVFYPHTLLHGYTNPSSPDVSSFWFPTLDRPGEQTSFAVSLAVPKGSNLSLIGPGRDDIPSIGEENCTIYHSFLSIAVPPCAIGIVIGPFDSTLFNVKVQKRVEEDSTFEVEETDVTTIEEKIEKLVRFTLPMDTNLVENQTLDFIIRAFGFYENLCSTKFPFPSLQIVFVHDPSVRMQSFAGLILVNRELLHTEAAIETGMEARELFALGIAKQWFGCFLSYSSEANTETSDSWLPIGLAENAARTFLRSLLGEDYGWTRHIRENDVLCRREWRSSLSFDLAAGALDRLITGRVQLKAAHVMHGFACGFVLQKNKVYKLLVATDDDGTKQSDGTDDFTFSQAPLITLISFIRLLTHCNCNLSAYNDLWVKKQGLPPFECRYTIPANNKPTEVSIIPLGDRKNEDYHTTITIKTIEKVGGNFEPYIHSLNFKRDEKFSLKLQTKTRGRRRTNKFGPEQDDLSAAVKTQIQWLQVDPDYIYPRRVIVTCRQESREKERDKEKEVVSSHSEDRWRLQLRNGTDLRTKLEAVFAFRDWDEYGLRKPNADSESDKHSVVPPYHKDLIDSIKNDKYYYELRIEAAKALSSVASGVSRELSPIGLDETIEYYKQQFFDQIHPLPNDFHSLVDYYLRRDIPLALAAARDSAGTIYGSVAELIIQLLKGNNNTQNPYSDAFYIAGLIRCLRCCPIPAPYVTSARHTVSRYLTRECVSLEHMRAHSAGAIGTLERTFSIVVAAESILALARLCADETTPEKKEIEQQIWEFTKPKYDTVLRIAGYCGTCLVTHLHGDTLKRILDMIECKCDCVSEMDVENETANSQTPIHQVGCAASSPRSQRICHSVFRFLTYELGSSDYVELNRLTPENARLVRRYWMVLNSSITASDTALRVLMLRFFKKAWNVLGGEVPGPLQFGERTLELASPPVAVQMAHGKLKFSTRVRSTKK